MGLSVTCVCGKTVVARDEFAGRRAKCPNCGAVVKLPGVEVEAPAAARVPDVSSSPAPRSSPREVSSAREPQATTTRPFHPWQDGLTQYSTPWLPGDEEKFQRGIRMPYEGLSCRSIAIVCLLLAMAAAGAGWYFWPQLKALSSTESSRSGDLDLIPGDALCFASIRVADLWNNKVLEPVRRMVSKQEENELRQLWGFFFEDIERLSLVSFPTEIADRGTPFCILMQMNRPLSRQPLLGTFWRQTGPIGMVRDDSWFKPDALDTIYFANPTLVVLGNELGVDKLRRRKKPQRSERLDAALRLAKSGEHSIVAHVELETEANAAMTANMLPEELRHFLSLRKAVVTVDLGDSEKLEARLTFSNAAAASIASQKTSDLAKRPGNLLKQTVGELFQNELAAEIAGPIAAALTVQTENAEVSFTLRPDPGALCKLYELAGPILDKVRATAYRAEQSIKLRSIGLAILEYQEEHERFPPPVVGAGLSWRVALLPYLSHNDLYKEFRLDQPWDSEHNIKLLPKMPSEYKPCPGAKALDHCTFYQVCIGPEAPFLERKGLRLLDFHSRGAATILVVESSAAVPWTKPADITVGSDAPTFGAQFAGVFLALYADGAVRSLPRHLSAEQLRTLISPRGASSNPIRPPPQEKQKP